MEDFEIWFDDFVDRCRLLGYKGPIDTDSAQFEWDSGKDADKAAIEFVKEMNEK